MIGNTLCRLNSNLGFNLPLQVPLAASSCFPGGFEPIILPLASYKDKDSKNPFNHVSLMDGGIVDNQGIDSLISYNDNIVQSSKSTTSKSKTVKPLDLVMAIDVASPSFKEFEESKDFAIPYIGDTKMITISNFIFYSNIISAAILFISLWYASPFSILIFSVLTTLLTCISIMLNKGKKLVLAAAEKEEMGIGKIKPINTLTPNAIAALSTNRFKSVSLLVSSVFMKHLRRTNTTSLFTNKNLYRKSILNAIYQLKETKPEDEKVRMSTLKLPDFIAIGEPTPEIRLLCTKAYEMGTTLWVSKSDMGKQLVQTVMVAGQITTCANLLNHYAKVICTDGDSCKKTHSYRMHLEDLKKIDINNEKLSEDAIIFKQALQDWEKFRQDPYWLLEAQGIEIINPLVSRQKQHIESLGYLDTSIEKTLP